MSTNLHSPIPEARIGEFQSLIDIVARLRGPGGCPWDAEQTHQSLKRNLLEECYETLEAIDAANLPSWPKSWATSWSR